MSHIVLDSTSVVRLQPVARTRKFLYSSHLLLNPQSERGWKIKPTLSVLVGGQIAQTERHVYKVLSKHN